MRIDLEPSPEVGPKFFFEFFARKWSSTIKHMP